MNRLSLLFCLVLLNPLALLAQNAPVGDAATVLDLQGSPEMSTDGKIFEKLQLGQGVPVGALIHTGLGKVSLLLSEGSTVRMGQNTEMTLKEHDPQADNGGTIFGLAKGFASFLVSKLQPGKHFEVDSPNAVAAVKGTFFEDGVGEDGKTNVTVFPHNDHGQVQLTDLVNQANSILLKESESGSFDGKSFEKTILKIEQIEKILNKYDQGSKGTDGGGANGGPPAGGTGSQAGSGDQGGDDTAKQLAQDLKNAQHQQQQQEMAALAQQLTNEIYQDHAIEQEMENAKEMADVTEQRIVTDQYGEEVFVTHLVTRPNPITIVNTTTDVRLAGGTGGAGAENATSSMVEATIFNSTLPQDWVSAFRAPVNPALYRVHQDFVLENTVDELEIDTAFQAPVLSGSVYLQPLDQQYLNNGVLALDLVLTPSLSSGLYNVPVGAGGGGGQINPEKGTEYDYSFSVNSFSLQENLVAVQDAPNGQPITLGVSGGSAPSSFWGPNFAAWNPSAGPFNVEATFSWTGMNGSGVDVVLLNGSFDNYDVNVFQQGLPFSPP
jgi:hypothetical protein